MCICGSEKSFDECCGTIILGKRQANTPEELMRSRFSAYVRADGKYLVDSALKEKQHEDDAALIQEFSNSVEWLKLDILTVQGDTVEFKAYYKDGENIQVLHEKSNFVLDDGIWKYKDGELYNSKVERNESCPCGSGKKYKKCCA
ncbi:zinc chelation protein SecC [Sulfurimonas aquatica]|uniref:Zinc chelation protein SecC n=1 Tax=Sulfurimonas aquatica TaxID=2672570 RepID=A0A975AZ46_9BACT|nr:YchJ family protein [Sulfurimonas aquatica]QSZ41188.1 zinc chelation protein SecC [Sulfurimonas aquatica]